MNLTLRTLAFSSEGRALRFALDGEHDGKKNGADNDLFMAIV